MDFEVRKKRFAKELLSIENENILATLERVLKREKEVLQEISANHKRELDNRMDNYKQNPDDVLDWEDVKNDWY